MWIEIYDYVALTYTPEYYLKETVYINNSDIQSVIRTGFMDDDQRDHLLKLYFHLLHKFISL